MPAFFIVGIGDTNALPCVLGVGGLRCIGYFHATDKTIVNDDLLHSRFAYAYNVMNLYFINQHAKAWHLVISCRSRLQGAFQYLSLPYYILVHLIS